VTYCWNNDFGNTTIGNVIKDPSQACGIVFRPDGVGMDCDPFGTTTQIGPVRFRVHQPFKPLTFEIGRDALGNEHAIIQGVKFDRSLFDDLSTVPDGVVMRFRRDKDGTIVAMRLKQVERMLAEASDQEK
jgi:hypothetical protein